MFDQKQNYYELYLRLTDEPQSKWNMFENCTTDQLKGKVSAGKCGKCFGQLLGTEMYSVRRELKENIN